MFVLGCMSAAIISLASCLKEPAGVLTEGKQITLSVGFEDQVSVENAQEADTKTYLQNEKDIQWGSTSADKVIYVFDSKGAKNVFNATGNIVNGKYRDFTGVISNDSEISAVIWTGVAESTDKCAFENGVFSGSTLKLEAKQDVNNAKSFDNTANIAVMKPGDKVLRNVFGYIKYTVPTVEGGTAGAIKSVTFSADQPLAGKVEIDYSGDTPVATIADAAASNAITVNTRVKNNALEAGNLYAVVPVGTYTNFNIKVTLPDDTSFDLPVNDPVIIERGKYTSAGTLPTSDPFASEEPEPEPEEPEETVWPNDEEAFDYGLANGNSRRAEYPAADITAAGVEQKVPLSKPATIGDITYGAGVTYYGNRISCPKVSAWSEEYPDVIPSNNYQSFKINRPGSVSFYQAIFGATDRIPTYYMAVLTTVNGVTSAKIVDSFTPDVNGIINGQESSGRPNNPYTDDKYNNYIISLSVSAEDLKGITEAATVYIYHTHTLNRDVLYYPLLWTSNGEESSSAQRTGKFLLAGDSLVTEYGESSAPQTGWGQCLSEALGGGVQVSNHAIGGESTKSFIDSGKWQGLINATLRGDIVMIQFMHNDQKTAETHATDPATTYRENLKKFINDARDRGATPVLVTSVLRRQFDSSGNPRRSLGEFPDAMRAVATETNTPLIDCEQWSYNWLSELGEEGAEPYYIVYKRGAANPDNTHFTKEGAEIVAKFIADEIIRLGIWSK